MKPDCKLHLPVASVTQVAGTENLPALLNEPETCALAVAPLLEAMDTVAMPFMAPFASTVALPVSAVTCVRTGCGMTVTLAVRLLSAVVVSPATGAALAVMLRLPAGAPVVLKLTV